ncbi:MAG: exonuclease SbcCD subunit D [Lachnospiraceae bacterium]|nr:exonuclease SbcCD subunit D [Lachnospiraceae bacterium]
MKLIHTSDWHLGMTLRGGSGYEADQRAFIEEIIKITVREKAEGIIIAGDVFDKSVASREALQIYDETMTRICGDLKIPVYLIAGNHDGAERISGCSRLLKNSGLHIAGTLTADPDPVTVGDTDIYLLPWISTDRVKALYPEYAESIVSMEDAFRVVLDRIRERFTPGQKNILVAHAFILNAETSESDRAAEVGKATMVSASLFEGFDYVALGHLHGPQDVNERIRYSGSPMAYSFGKEEKQEKSVTLIDTGDMSRKVIPLPELHKRLTLSGSFEELMKADFSEDILDAYIRLEIKDSYVGMDSIAAFREKYRNLLEISSRGFEKEDAKITMTMEEFEKADKDPETIFERYCMDIMEEAPGEHLTGLFKAALTRSMKEKEEA